MMAASLGVFLLCFLISAQMASSLVVNPFSQPFALRHKIPAVLLALSVFSSGPAFAVDGSGFVGTYSDPINHPGGTRIIKLLDVSILCC